MTLKAFVNTHCQYQSQSLLISKGGSGCGLPAREQGPLGWDTGPLCRPLRVLDSDSILFSLKSLSHQTSPELLSPGMRGGCKDHLPRALVLPRQATLEASEIKAEKTTPVLLF